MKRLAILVFLISNQLLYSQISLSRRAVDYFGMYNYSEGEKLSSTMIDDEPMPFILLGPTADMLIISDGYYNFNMEYRVNRIGIGPLSVSARYIDNFLYQNSRDGINEDLSRSVDGSLVIKDAMEIGGRSTNVDEIKYESLKLNILDLTNLFGDRSLYIGDFRVAQLSNLRSFNVITYENGEIPAISSFTSLGLPLLTSISNDIFIENDYYFLTPTFTTITGPFFFSLSPKVEINNSKLINMNIGFDYYYFVSYLLFHGTKDWAEMEESFKSLYGGMLLDDVPNTYGRGSMRGVLNYEYGIYNPYISLDDQSIYHELGFSLMTYAISIDHRPYSPNDQDEWRRGNQTHRSTKRRFRIVGEMGMDFAYRINADSGDNFRIRFLLKLGIPWGL